VVRCQSGSLNIRNIPRLGKTVLQNKKRAS
jgi:hypothetical protein